MANLNLTLQTFVNNSDGTTTGNLIGLTGGTVTSIPVRVAEADGTTAVTGLGISNFTLYTASAPTTPITSITVTADPDTVNKAGYYIIDITAGAPSASDYLLVNVQRTTGTPPNTVTDTGSLFLDPSSSFNNQGTGIINYPVNFGNQKFVLGQVNQSSLLNTMSAAFNFVKAASALNCSITLKGANPLQSIVIPANGTLVPVEIILKDGDTNPITGPQSVTISTQSVPLVK